MNTIKRRYHPRLNIYRYSLVGDSANGGCILRGYVGTYKYTVSVCTAFIFRLGCEDSQLSNVCMPSVLIRCSSNKNRE